MVPKCAYLEDVHGMDRRMEQERGRRACGAPMNGRVRQA